MSAFTECLNKNVEIELLPTLRFPSRINEKFSDTWSHTGILRRSLKREIFFIFQNHESIKHTFLYFHSFMIISCKVACFECFRTVKKMIYIVSLNSVFLVSYCPNFLVNFDCQVVQHWCLINLWLSSFCCYDL